MGYYLNFDFSFIGNKQSLLEAIRNIKNEINHLNIIDINDINYNGKVGIVITLSEYRNCISLELEQKSENIWYGYDFLKTSHNSYTREVEELVYQIIPVIEKFGIVCKLCDDM